MVFEDPSRTRWKWVRRIALCAVLVGVLLLADFVASLTIPPTLPRLRDASSKNPDDQVTRAALSGSLPTPLGSQPRSDAAKGGLLRTAFVVQDDPDSIADLRRNISHLDWVFPDWFTIVKDDGTLQTRTNPALRNLLLQGGVHVLPRLSNTDAAGTWHGEILGNLFEEEGGPKLIAALVEQLTALHGDGINIDFEDVDASDRDSYLDWLQSLARALHARRMKLTIDVPVGEEDSFDYEFIGDIADAVIVMGYDEHYPGSAPGPVASQAWFDDAIEDMAQRIKPEKLIAAVGAYGYDWNITSHQSAEALGFAELTEIARDHQAHVQLDKDALNSTFSYRDHDGQRHEVWFLDAMTAWNQCRTARRCQYAGVSLWRLGMEEPALWDSFSLNSTAAFRPQILSTIAAPTDVLFHGQGEFVDVRSLPTAGARTLSFDGDRIDYASYDRLPAPCEVYKHGHASGRRVALTFDDGPDPIWTPQILDVLRTQHAPATFFVVGEQVQKFPEVVKRAVEEGHLIGNHTFMHPDVGALSDRRLRLELTATQRIIESTTGKQTLLFRTPYDTDSMPTFAAQLRPLALAVGLGYVCVGGDVDSDDYDRPGAQRIVENVLARLKDGNPNIIVMHDAGGDRGQTVAALGCLIPMLRRQGYELVSVADLLGEQPDGLMPKVVGTERMLVTADQAISWLCAWGWWAMMKLFLLTTGFALFRSILLGFLVFDGSRKKRTVHAGFSPSVLLLIPAYNEAKVIRRTLEAALDSDYPNFRILVVDDGSTDQTAAIVADFAHAHPQVGLLSKPNGGKFSALNCGFREAWEEYIVTIDADTIVLPDTVGHLVARFSDPTADAVCGNVQVGNREGMLTRMQDAEYVTSQNYDRRAFDAANCIPVVPGACGAWRRRAVLRVGGYSSDTLTEDADLTLTMICQGAKIVYEPLARAVTEAPRNTRALLRQRFRWGFGTFQSLWKHRRHFARGSVGLIALPNLLLFQVVFPALAPLSMLVVAVSLLRGVWALPLIWFLVFVVVDLAGAAVAFRLERRSLRELWVVMAQRFYYRPFMYVITLRSLLAALRGSRHGWNKLERHASVRVDLPAVTPAAIKMPVITSGNAA